LRRSASWFRFFTLQALTALVIFATLTFSERGTLFVLLAAQVGGMVLIVQQTVQALRRGVGLIRMFGKVVLTTTILAVPWLAVLVAYANVASIPATGSGYVLLLAPPLMTFSSGCLAAMHLGPFSATLPPMEQARPQDTA